MNESQTLSKSEILIFVTTLFIVFITGLMIHIFFKTHLFISMFISAIIGVLIIHKMGLGWERERDG